MNQAAEQEQFLGNLSHKADDIIGCDMKGPWFDEHCRELFRMLRAAKMLKLIPDEAKTSSKDVQAFTKLARAWRRTKTPEQMRTAIAEHLCKCGMPEGMCSLFELGI